MITGKGFPREVRHKIEVQELGGQSVFSLPFTLTENHIIFIGGIITDINYTGIGTQTLTFSQSIGQGEDIFITK